MIYNLWRRLLLFVFFCREGLDDTLKCCIKGMNLIRNLNSRLFLHIEGSMNRKRLAQPSRALVIATSIITAMFPLALGSPSFGASETQLQNEATQLANQIADQSTQIHLLAVQESNDALSLAVDAQRLNSARIAFATSEARLNRNKELLREIALNQFTHETGASAFVALFTSTESQYTARLEFEKVMGLDVSTALLSYQAALGNQTKKLDQLNSAQAMALSEKDTIDSAKSRLEGIVSQEEATMNSLNSQITSIVQQQIAARIFAQLQAQKVQVKPQSPSQGAPSDGGISAVATNSAGVSNWGGKPAPPSPAALAALRQCESGGNYSDNTGNGYYGAYQFSLSTWQRLGFSGIPSDSPPQVQDQAATMLAGGGWYAWPECALVLGLD